LQKVEWEDVRADQVVIRSEVSKTKRRRFIDLSDNAKLWLDAFVLRGGVKSGRIVGTLSESELRSKRTAARMAAKIKHWPNSAMRHTYCSNWLAVHKDVNKLVLQSGHSSVDTMWRHYHQGMSEDLAKDYWRISPGV
jgi:integrase